MRDRGPRPGVSLLDDVHSLRTGYLRLRSAVYDKVTGLSSYHLHVDRLMEQAKGSRLGVIVVDFPSFGGMEAIHGWETGDRFLSGIASLLGALKGRGLPESTVIALEGACGTTFLLFVLEGPEGEELCSADLEASAGNVLRHMTARLESASWATPFRTEYLVGHAIIGISSTARFERLLSQGIQDARAMTLRTLDRAQRERADELRRILRGARLRTHYQPIVDMESDTIMGYEALTRGPENTAFEVPEALFSCSDSVSLSGELDALCRCEAVRNARGFDPAMKLFVNALPEALQSGSLDDGGLKRIIRETNLQPRNIVLEITERYAIKDFEAFSRELNAIRLQGYLVAIDDVGTGYSSLHSISEVQPDFLKVDISLVKNVHQSLIKQHLVRSLLQVGSRIGARVIAEGIESEEECRSVRSCGIRYGQGFYFARPAPPFPTLHHRGAGSA